MQIKIYNVINIDDYFFYIINPTKGEVNSLQSKYPKGVKEIKEINLDYEYHDIFIKKILEAKLNNLAANNIFFRMDSLNDFENVISKFKEDTQNLETFLISSMEKINSDKYTSDIFSKNIKLKFDVVKNMSNHFNKDINYFQFKKDNLSEDSILYKVLDKYDNFNLFVNFNNQSFIKKI